MPCFRPTPLPAAAGLTRWGAVFALCALLSLPTAHAKQIQVPGDYPTIQGAIDAADPLDTVIVAPGTYYENIRFNGKDLTLSSTDPTSAGVVASTIIDGSNKDIAIGLKGSETEKSVISGFTITHGVFLYRGGGILGNGSKVTIQDNIIRDNKSYEGGGICDCDGLIRRNVIFSNKTEESFVFGSYGGGIKACDGVIENNLIFGNEVLPGKWTVEKAGGGLSHCNGIIRNNVIYNNTADEGSGLFRCNGTIINNIVWQNNSRQSPMNQISDCVGPQYCAIQGWTGGGTGNITLDPLFVDAAGGDFRLQPGSPCIDAGGQVELAEDFARTFRPLLGVSEPRGDSSRYDIGAYEFVSPVSAVRGFTLYH